MNRIYIVFFLFLFGCADGISYSRAKEGAIMGALAGGGIGYAVKGPIGAGIGAAGGAVIGALVGSQISNPYAKGEFNETLALKREMVKDRCIQRVNNEAAEAMQVGRAWGWSPDEVIDPEEMRDEIRACIRKELGPRGDTRRPEPEKTMRQPHYSREEREIQREQAGQSRRYLREEEQETKDQEEEEVYVGEE